MSFLVDTNVLLRLADENSAEHTTAKAALERLLGADETVFIGTQVLVEFWAVATRPEDVNGLGWAVGAAAEAVADLRRQFPMLLETPDVVDCWYDLASRCQVSGKQVHDARLAALVIGHRVGRLLTFNTADFPPGWGVDAVHPEAVIRER
jgi:predicted nucleic acid-binding protein